jgi:predicted metal-binding protein
MKYEEYIEKELNKISSCEDKGYCRPAVIDIDEDFDDLMEILKKERKQILLKFKERLEEKLEEMYPKGDSKDRSKALVLFSYATIILKDLLEL